MKKGKGHRMNNKVILNFSLGDKLAGKQWIDISLPLFHNSIQFFWTSSCVVSTPLAQDISENVTVWFGANQTVTFSLISQAGVVRLMIFFLR